METQEEEKKVIIPSSLLIKVNNNSYDLPIPTIGQLIDIERMKMKLSDGTHNQMAFGGSQAQQAYLLTETIATLSILVPKLKEDITFSSLLDLNIMQSKVLVDIYENQIYPWLKSIRDAAAAN